MEDTPDSKPYQAPRSANSGNWRMPDSNPRQEFQPRFKRDGERGSPRGSNTNSPASSGEPGTRLYVGNLLYTAQTKDIEQLFQDNGFTPANVIMSTDPFTGRNPSYCFVDMETPDEASKAMDQLNGQDVLGRAVRINPGVAKRSGEGTPARIRNYESGGRGSPSNTTSSPSSYKPTFDRWNRSSDSPSHYQSTQSSGLRLYVGGLPRIEPQSAVDELMQQLFSVTIQPPVNITAVSKIISPHPSKIEAEPNGNHYYCFVDLATGEEVDSVVRQFEEAGVPEGPWGTGVRVGKAKDNRDRKVVREQYGGEGRDRGEGRGEARSTGERTWRRD